MRFYFLFLAQFFTPDRRRAGRPFRFFRWRICSNPMAILSALVSGGGTNGTSFNGAGSSPSSGGKSWIDQLLTFIEQNT